MNVFNFEVVTTGDRPFTGQLREAQRIADDMASGQLSSSWRQRLRPRNGTIVRSTEIFFQTFTFNSFLSFKIKLV